MDVGGDLRSTRDSSTTLVPIWSPLLRKTSHNPAQQRNVKKGL